MSAKAELRWFYSSRVHRAVVIAFAIATTAFPTTSYAASTSRTVTGNHGEVLTVSKIRAIKSGEVLTITGNRFDETVGIYVAFCVTPKKGYIPSPCGGGADQTGATGASKWISSNPPPYGQGVATPFRAGGRFTVKIKVVSKIGAVDCRKKSCSVVVRADHTRSDDRSHDLVVPITFKK